MTEQLDTLQSASLSELGLGCWSFGDPYWMKTARNGRDITPAFHRKYKKIIRSATGFGIRHFDTAQGYGGGLSEQITGQALKQHRSSVRIASKTFLRPPETMIRGIEKSLRRMQTDYIDIFYLHWPKPGRDLRPHIEALEQARSRGLICSIGLSNFQPSQILPLMNAGRIDFCQFGYSLLWRIAEKNLIPFCLEHGIHMVSYSSLAQGFLAHDSSWSGFLPPDDPRRRLVFAAPEHSAELQRVLRKFSALAADADFPPAQLALLWNLSRGWFTYVLFGARDMKQLEECAASRSRIPGRGLIEELKILTDPLAEELAGRDNIFGHSP